MEVSLKTYLKALQIVERYHKQIGLDKPLKTDPEIARGEKLRAGSIITCARPYKTNKNLTAGKDYTVVRTENRRYNGEVFFYIIDDNGKQKHYGEQNTQFDVKQY